MMRSLTVIFCLLMAFPSMAADIRLEWDHSPDLDPAGHYRIWYGHTPGSYSGYADVGYVTSHILRGLGSGEWYMAATAIAASGQESDYSNELEIAIGGTPYDFDGDGKADVSVWRPSNGTWYVIPSASPASMLGYPWGIEGDIPVAADYDGDNLADMAVYRPSSGVWFIRPSRSTDTYTATQWGLPNDAPVPADYDGDGKADIAVWREDGGLWYVLPSGSLGTYLVFQWGMAGDVPIMGINAK